MARKPSILDALTDTDQPEPAETTTEPVAPEPEPEESTEQPPKARKTTRRAPAARKAARRPGPTRPAEPPAPEADEPEEKPVARREGPQVLKPESTTAAARISLYLHPDDKRMLALKKVDDAIDENSRVRALLALYRYDERLAKRTDKLALEFRNR